MCGWYVDVIQQKPDIFNTLLHEKCVKNIRLLNLSDASYTITGYFSQVFLRKLLRISDYQKYLVLKISDNSITSIGQIQQSDIFNTFFVQKCVKYIRFLLYNINIPTTHFIQFEFSVFIAFSVQIFAFLIKRARFAFSRYASCYLPVRLLKASLYDYFGISVYFVFSINLYMTNSDSAYSMCLVKFY